jgi:predicted ATP-dependent serine protease
LQKETFGLLNGFDKKQKIGDFRHKFYSDKIDAKRVSERLSESNVLWSAFMEDITASESVSDILKNIANNANTHASPKNKQICDRSEIIESLQNILVGELVILTGGPSTGKSLVVNHLFANRSDCLYLNGRRTGSNMKAIISNIKKRDILSKKTLAATNAIIRKVIPNFGKLFRDQFEVFDVLEIIY